MPESAENTAIAEKREENPVRAAEPKSPNNSSAQKVGNENSARSFSDRSFFEPPWGHGRPRLRVMDVRTEMLVFPGFRGLDRSFCPRTSAGISAKIGAKKSTQTFFVQSFSTTLRVIDVRAENRGRPHQKVRFSAAPVVGRNFLTPGYPAVRVRNVREKSGPKFFFMLFFLLCKKVGFPPTRQSA